MSAVKTRKTLIMLVIYTLAAPSTLINAATTIYFYNRTPFTITMDRKQYGGPTLTSDAWGKEGSDTIAPGEHRKVMWLNRNVGIEKGKTYKLGVFFSIDPLTAESSQELDTAQSTSKPTVILEQKLVGTLAGSKLSQALGGSGFAEAWKSDRNLYRQSIGRGAETFTLSYQAVAAGTWDDIEYALNWSYKYPEPKATAANEINIGFQNLWMRQPLFAIGCTSTRAAMIPDIIGPKYDVLVFSEAFYTKAANILFSKLSKKGYKYKTKIVGQGSAGGNGGVAILSKWPIDTSKEMIFRNACDSPDCMAGKGVMYAKINKQGKPYHIFGTHTQASYGKPSVSTVTARVKQLRDFKTFIDKQNIPKNEPVFIVGDMNVNMIEPNNRYNEFNYLGLNKFQETGATKPINEYTYMLNTLNVAHPTLKGYKGEHEKSKTGQQMTFNRFLNVLATPDESDAGEDFAQFLDYVLISKDHLQPTTSFNEMRMYTTPKPYTCKKPPTGIAMFRKDIKFVSPISDHWFIYGYFKFPQ